MGHDQWANFYSFYTVLGSKIEVTTMTNGGTAATQRSGVTPTTTSSAFATTDQERAEELPYSAIARYQAGGSSSANTGIQYVSSYMSTAKMQGIVRAAVQIEDDYTALFSADPSAPWFWHVWNYVPGGETQSVYQIVRITYYCVFSGRTTMSVS